MASLGLQASLDCVEIKESPEVQDWFTSLNCQVCLGSRACSAPKVSGAALEYQAAQDSQAPGGLVVYSASRANPGSQEHQAFQALQSPFSGFSLPPAFPPSLCRWASPLSTALAGAGRGAQAERVTVLAACLSGQQASEDPGPNYSAMLKEVAIGGAPWAETEATRGQSEYPAPDFQC
ncbi:hypothetical protein J1605_010559 [Eschrichtius robustus]|uniref:Uncharacterized protein n=1 Tax=Eschrichtius robustus TaxID=9764 RepID=A0AB34GTB7_ESCRO|nr:hypothetical protein J1605_010559 [Eschrichtius robustus]